MQTKPSRYWPHLFSVCSSVKVVLQDVDDNVPVFEREVYVATLKENSPPETLVTQMIAYDADSEKHSQIEYEIIQGKRSI